MFRKILFICGLPKTIYRIGSEMLESDTPLKAYGRCRHNISKVAQYYLGAWFEALWQGDEERVAREAERLWKVFKKFPMVRMVVNLTFYIRFAWDEKFQLCDLFIMTLQQKTRAFLRNKVPDSLLYYEFMFICNFFTGADNIQLFIYQLPANEHSLQLKTKLLEILRTADAQQEIQIEAMHNAMNEAKEWGEMMVVSHLIEAVYIRDRVLEVNGITATGGKWMQEIKNYPTAFEEGDWEAC